MFEFLDYHFDPESAQVTFRYRGADDTIFTEEIFFKKPADDYDTELLDRALFLAFVLSGTSYYKAQPTKTVKLNQPLTASQADFFSRVYQDGLSQFAFENSLTRADLAHFTASTEDAPNAEVENDITAAPEPPLAASETPLVLQSGGKDSLLTATLLAEEDRTFSTLFISSDGSAPDVLKSDNLQIITRKLDLKNLKNPAYKNGHVPVTFINQSLALVQAILNGQTTVLTSIGQEGNEPATIIKSPAAADAETEPDLPVNHQWSKTAAAERLFQNYLSENIAKNLTVTSPLRRHTEPEIARLFVAKCWEKYGHAFSSCNIANYKQSHLAAKLTWCGRCAKCANSYLLFCPYLEAAEQQSLFNGEDLLEVPELTDTFKGLLGVDNILKPFECVGEVRELRNCYAHKLAGYGDLPFEI